MKTAATNKKVRDIIQAVRQNRIVPRPEFQRRLVWSRNDKNHFIDTILRKFPFPEIYLADGDVDLETGEGTQLLVDGLQRVSTMIQYFEGDPELKLTTVPAYRELTDDEKRDFLQYDVAVRDLGAITRDQIIETFQRLNATRYSLLDIEVNNAVYAGAFKRFAEQLSSDPFFERHAVFTSQDLKRMGDLRFAITVIITVMEGYFNRDDAFQTYLARFNDDFPFENEVRTRILNTFAFIEECGFPSNSRVWRKADLLTLIVELDQAITVHQMDLQPSTTVEYLGEFYDLVDKVGLGLMPAVSTYYKAALQASNDRVNRVRRGCIIAGVLRQHRLEDIWDELHSQGLVQTGPPPYAVQAQIFEEQAQILEEIEHNERDSESSGT